MLRQQILIIILVQPGFDLNVKWIFGKFGKKRNANEVCFHRAICNTVAVIKCRRSRGSKPERKTSSHAGKCRRQSEFGRNYTQPGKLYLSFQFSAGGCHVSAMRSGDKDWNVNSHRVSSAYTLPELIQANEYNQCINPFGNYIVIIIIIILNPGISVTFFLM